MFFFEKKNQKFCATLVRSRIPPPERDSGRQEKKFFASFFQKRSASFSVSIVCFGMKVTP
jgi:hypothetical protein